MSLYTFYHILYFMSTFYCFATYKEKATEIQVSPLLLFNTINLSILLIFVIFACLQRRLTFLRLRGEKIHNDDRKNYNCYYDKYTKHSLPHILEREKKSINIEIAENIHIRLLSSNAECAKSSREAEDKSACDNRRYLSRNVYADRMHQKEVLRIFLESHLVNDTS